jgi:hypothetical protein
MPRRHVPAPLALPFLAPFLIPACQTCGKQMRLCTVEPCPRYTNIDSHNYVCDCGWHEDFLVARKIGGSA